MDLLDGYLNSVPDNVWVLDVLLDPGELSFDEALLLVEALPLIAVDLEDSPDIVDVELRLIDVLFVLGDEGDVVVEDSEGRKGGKDLPIQNLKIYLRLGLREEVGDPGGLNLKLIRQRGHLLLRELRLALEPLWNIL